MSLGEGPWKGHTGSGLGSSTTGVWVGRDCGGTGGRRGRTRRRRRVGNTTRHQSLDGAETLHGHNNGGPVSGSLLRDLRRVPDPPGIQTPRRPVLRPRTWTTGDSGRGTPVTREVGRNDRKSKPAKEVECHPRLLAVPVGPSFRESYRSARRVLGSPLCRGPPRRRTTDSESFSLRPVLSQDQDGSERKIFGVGVPGRPRPTVTEKAE